MRSHILKINDDDDFEFMCGTHTFGAVISARDVCQSCQRKTLLVVELLAQARDELKVLSGERISKLLKQINRVLGEGSVQ